MNNPDLNLEIKNASALSRAESLSLTEPHEEPRNPFDAPLCDEEGDR